MLKKWGLIALKITVSVGLIWFIMKDLDVDAALVRLRQIDLMMLFFAMCTLGLQACLGGIRWRAISIAIEAPLSLLEALRLFYIGMFFNQALPGGTGGDAVRMYLGYRSGVSLRGAINGVMLERMVTVVALVIMVDITQPFFTAETNFKDAELLHMAAIVLTLAVVSGLAFIMVLDRLPESMSKWKIIRGLGYLAHDARRIFLSIHHGFTGLTLGLLTHINLSWVVYLLASGLDLPITFFDCLILVPPVILASTIPISIGGWGIREGAMVMAFGLAGVPAEGALVLSILVGLTGLSIALPGGLVWLFSRERGQGAGLDHMEEELSISDS
jgi:uncharacterized protein (TIRG00374 family)